jgi:hypothetical protein
MISSLIGWTATALFAMSYAFKEPQTLRRWQALAAGVWIAYGILIASAPVIVANGIVAALALASSMQASRPAPLPVEDGEEGCQRR